MVQTFKFICLFNSKDSWGSSTTQITDLSRFVFEQIAHGSVSVIFEQIVQYRTLSFTLINAFAIATTSSRGIFNT